VTTPATVDAVDSGGSSRAGHTASLAVDRHRGTLTQSFTVGGEVNLNAVWKFDGANDSSWSGGAGV
jgi:hypothetical protein